MFKNIEMLTFFQWNAIASKFGKLFCTLTSRLTLFHTNSIAALTTFARITTGSTFFPYNICTNAIYNMVKNKTNY